MNVLNLLSNPIGIKILEYVIRNASGPILKEIYDYTLTLEAKASKTDNPVDDLLVGLLKEVITPFI